MNHEFVLKNMIKDYYKKNEGITLVALVVTIIVLLILAAVSIDLVLGDNGIITRAKQSAKETDYAIVKNSVNECSATLLSDFLNNNLENKSFEEYVTKEKLEENLNNKYDVLEFNINAENIEMMLIQDKKTDKQYIVILEDKEFNVSEVNNDNNNYEWVDCDCCSAENPHLIKSKYDLDQIRTHITNVENEDGSTSQYISGFFKLDNDIFFMKDDYSENGDFYNDGYGFVPIGGDLTNNGYGCKNIPSKIEFDGNNKTIYNLKINKTQNMQYRNGIFTALTEGYLKNLTIKNANVYIPTKGGILAMYIGDSFLLENINIINSKLDVWKPTGSMDSVGIVAGDINGTINGLKIINSTFNAPTWYSGIITSSIEANARFNDIEIKGCTYNGYVESGLLAYRINPGAQLNNINVSDTVFNYTHGDINRSGIICCLSNATSAENQPIIENSNISIVYNGTLRKLVTSGFAEIKNSTIEVIHNTSKSDMLITSGDNVTLDNTDIITGYLDENGDKNILEP